MCDYPGLVRALLLTKYGVDATVKTYLTDEEAAGIRALGFETATAGWWDVPPVPPELVRDNGLFEHLASGWPPYLTYIPANLRTGEGPSLVDERLGMAERNQPRPVGPMAADRWLAQFGTVDHHRVLAAMVRQPTGTIRKRTLQQLFAPPPRPQVESGARSSGCGGHSGA